MKRFLLISAAVATIMVGLSLSTYAQGIGQPFEALYELIDELTSRMDIVEEQLDNLPNGQSQSGRLVVFDSNNKILGDFVGRGSLMGNSSAGVAFEIEGEYYIVSVWRDGFRPQSMEFYFRGDVCGGNPHLSLGSSSINGENPYFPARGFVIRECDFATGQCIAQDPPREMLYVTSGSPKYDTMSSAYNESSGCHTGFFLPNGYYEELIPRVDITSEYSPPFRIGRAQ